MTSVSAGHAVPLVQTEASIFNIFWCQNEDGSYPGALPAGLFADKKNGLQALEDHIYV